MRYHSSSEMPSGINISCHIPIGNVDHPFSVGVSEVALVGWSEMNLGLVKRIRDAIWENTRRQTRNHFGYSELVCIMEYIVIDEHVVSQERVLRNSIDQSLVGGRHMGVPYLELHVIV
jgi:hypothetical protein